MQQNRSFPKTTNETKREWAHSNDIEGLYQIGFYLLNASSLRWATASLRFFDFLLPSPSTWKWIISPSSLSMSAAVDLRDAAGEADADAPGDAPGGDAEVAAALAW